MKYLYAIAVLLFFFIQINAQDLLLVSGSKTKTIEAGTFIEIELPAQNTEPCEKCSSGGMIGQFVGYENGQVKLKVKTMHEPLSEENSIVGYTSKKYTKKETAPVLSIPKDVILSITQRGKNKLRDNTTGQVIGFILLFFGTGHLSAAAISELNEDNSGGLLLKLGLAEVALGTVMSSVFKQRPYITSEKCPQLKENSKVWVIQ